MHVWNRFTLTLLLGLVLLPIHAQQAVTLPENAAPESVGGFQAQSDTQAPSRPTIAGERKSLGRSYLSDMLGPGAFISAGLQAGVDQARPLKVGYPPDGYSAVGEHPSHGAVPEWGLGADGYAKRYASRFGQGLVGTTVYYGIGLALSQDVTYHRCECTGFLPRTSHALAQSFLAHTRSGRAVPSVAAFVSPFVASEVAVKAWYPQRYNESDALRTSATLYVGLPLKNLFKEFIR